MMSSSERSAGGPLIRHVHIGSGYDTVVDWGGLARGSRTIYNNYACLRAFFW